MAKFHLKEDGTPGTCTAREGNCPKGPSAEHFTSRADAAAHYEQVQAQNGATLVAVKKMSTAATEALRSMVGPSGANGALDLPLTPGRQRYREGIQDGLLTGDVAKAQENLQQWLDEIDRGSLSEGWTDALPLREAKARAFIEADAVAVESYLDQNYLRPHAVNPNDPDEVRGAITPKAEGWTVNGPNLEHASGMTLTMTPGYAAYAGWSIGGPEGWRERYFKTSSGLYPVSDHDLRSPRMLNNVASYGAAKETTSA